ncbi:hypothetical protein CVT26_001442, partial [Gymnopilus dilepis]
PFCSSPSPVTCRCRLESSKISQSSPASDSNSLRLRHDLAYTVVGRIQTPDTNAAPNPRSSLVHRLNMGALIRHERFLTSSQTLSSNDIGGPAIFNIDYIPLTYTGWNFESSMPKVPGSTPHSPSRDVTPLSSSAAISSPERSGRLAYFPEARLYARSSLLLWAFDGCEDVHGACGAKFALLEILKCIVTPGNTGMCLSMLLLSTSFKVPDDYATMRTILFAVGYLVFQPGFSGSFGCTFRNV